MWAYPSTKEQENVRLKTNFKTYKKEMNILLFFDRHTFFITFHIIALHRYCEMHILKKKQTLFTALTRLNSMRCLTADNGFNFVL